MKVSIIPWIVKKLKSCLALVEDGNTASQNIAKGKYVIWKGNMCTASSAISSGDTLSSSNLTAVSGGGLNALNSKFGNMQLVKVEETVTIGDGRQTIQTLEVDLSSYIPTGKSIVGNSVVRLGNYNLPYRSDDGTMNTWVEHVSAVTKKVRIKSNATRWENYVLSFILFIQ